MKPRDRERLEHILQATQEAQEFIEGVSRDELDENRLLAMGLIKEVEIIGEAANNLSDEIIDEYESIPWTDIQAMRHKLVHGYDEVKLEVVWETITQDLPELEKKIRGILN